MTDLKISAFRDITAFLLARIEAQSSLKFQVKYVQNAAEAHQDLNTHKADLVFMSYDDTLSIFIEENYPDILAIQPIHGGILDLCGSINLSKNTINIGIDTDSGYARVLRAYLRQTYSAADQEKFTFVKAGATNIRAEKLHAGELDATLLNPPFSCLESVKRDPGFRAFIRDYVGVVINTNQSLWTSPPQRASVEQFLEAYRRCVTTMRDDLPTTISQLASFYHIDPDTARKIYQRLWEENGLSSGFVFNPAGMLNTEKYFAEDTGLCVPSQRPWLEKANSL